MKKLLESTLLLGTILTLASCGMFGESKAVPRELFALSKVEERSVRAAVERSDQWLEARGDQEVFFVGVERLRDKRADGDEGPDRRALVMHYRPRDDVTIMTTVDVSEAAVVEVQEVPHFPARLSEEEFARAKQLALENAQVKEALAPHGDRLVIEPLVERVNSEDDPRFRHRLVRLLFRVGQSYLSDPVVVVDLTTKEVEVVRGGRSRE